MDKAFGVDVSSHQGLIDWDILGPKISFCGIRAAISWGYQDKFFPRNWAEARRLGKIRAAYHALYPGEDALRQMDHLFRILGDDLGELSPTVDAELVHSQTRLTITKKLVACGEITQARSGKRPLLYSRANWLEANTYPAELSGLFDLWLAQYLDDPWPSREHPGPPTVPQGWPGWLFHQTGNHTTGEGFGVKSKQLDYDRFNGSETALRAYAKLGPAPLPLSLEDRVARLERAAFHYGWEL